MNWNKHSNIRGFHAFLGASKYHWLNYDEEKLITVYQKQQAVKRGVELHELASMCIDLGQRLPRSQKTLNMYVNDAIGFRMRTEQPLFYSENCFGTADAISFRQDILRIHDLKTGDTPAKMEQLEIYAALFCLEYGVKPAAININLRIYQNDDIISYDPDPDEITRIMDLIVYFDDIINKLKVKEN